MTVLTIFPSYPEYSSPTKIVITIVVKITIVVQQQPNIVADLMELAKEEWILFRGKSQMKVTKFIDDWTERLSAIPTTGMTVRLLQELEQCKVSLYGLHQTAWGHSAYKKMTPHIMEYTVTKLKRFHANLNSNSGALLMFFP